MHISSSEAGCTARGLWEEVDRCRMAQFLWAPVTFTTSESQMMTGVITSCIE